MLEKVCKQDKKFDGQTFYNADLQGITNRGGYLILFKNKSLTPTFFLGDSNEVNFGKLKKMKRPLY
jgi:hypothetical protein